MKRENYKTIIRYLLTIIGCLCTATSCPEWETELWNVNNNFNECVVGINAEQSYGTISGCSFRSGYTKAFCTHLEYFPAGMTLPVIGYHTDRYNEIKMHAGLRMYFSLCLVDFEKNRHILVIKYALAYIDISLEWMEAHDWTVNFPEDCTVNPDLWKIYDLDKFVELYGPLKAQGWDEVWQKWEQSKEADS